MRRTPCRTRTQRVSQELQGYESDSGVSTLLTWGTPERYEIEKERITNETDSMAKQEQSQMEMMLQMLRQMREDDRVREERKEKERENREQEREERHCQLLRQLKDSQPAVPEIVKITQMKLPLMKDTDGVEIFVKQLETVMRSADVPRNK